MADKGRGKAKQRMSSPKILHLATAKSWRGGEQQLVYLAEELARKDVSQTIVCSKGSELEAYCQKYQMEHKAFAKRSSLDLNFARQLARLARNGQFDIVHAHDSHAHTFVVLAADLFGLKLPIVIHRKVDYAISRSFFSRYKYNHPAIRRIICVSHEVERVLAKSLRQADNCVVIHDGIDLDKFIIPAENILRKEFDISDETRLIGNVAAVTQQKDYFTFVETARLTLQKTRSIHFFIIGNGDQMEQIKALVASHHLNSHFTFTGFRKDINSILPCLDILLFTSEKEGLGTTILDAFAAGVPVVSTNAGGIPEIVEHNVNGLMAPVKDCAALALQLQRLLTEAGLREKLTVAAQQRVQFFSKENTAEKTLEIYRQLLKD